MASPRDQRLTLLSHAAFALVLMAIVCAYFYRLGSVPPGLFVDEVGDMVNADDILKTGADEYGNTMPLFFRNFEDYKSPILVYSIVVSQAIFGRTPFAVRLPSAVYAFGMAVALYFFLRALTGRALLARWLALLSLLVPATFTYGRHVVSETSTLPCFLVLALSALLLFERRPTWARAGLAGAAIGVVVYTYTTSRLLAPLILGAYVLAFILSSRREPSQRIKLLGMMASAAVVATPMALYMLLHPHALDGRFNALSAWRDHAPVGVVAGRIARTYFNHLSYGFLFRTGDLNLRHNIGGVGLLPLWLFAPLLAGLWSLWRRRERPIAKLLLALVVLAPIPVSLTEGILHASRTLHFVPLAIIIGALALDDLFERAPPSLPAIVLAIAVALGEGAFFVQRYFTEYPARAQAEFDQGMGDALDVLVAARENGEPVYLPRSFFVAMGIHIVAHAHLEPDWRQHQTLEQRGFHELKPGQAAPSGSFVILPGRAPGTAGRLIGTSQSVRDGSPLWSVFLMN